MPLSARGPADEPLTIDIARLGAATARNVILHLTGVHGVEAYTGSAVQLATLADLPSLPADTALVLLHAFNPWGMAWRRRTNENNVDLNRNCLGPGESWSGSPALYRALDPLINPASPPARDFFALRALLASLRHGFHAVKQAVAEGQYDFPKGLFYGGAALEAGPAAFCDWIPTALGHCRRLLVVDCHTGLGNRGEDLVLVDGDSIARGVPELSRLLGRALHDPSREAGAAYTIRGALGNVFRRLLPHVSTDYVLQEIGTAPALEVFHALREENRWHHYGDGSLTHPAKLRLMNALCPESPAWRERAVALGTQLLRSACNAVSGNESVEQP